MEKIGNDDASGDDDDDVPSIALLAQFDIIKLAVSARSSNEDDENGLLLSWLPSFTSGRSGYCSEFCASCVLNSNL